MSYYGTGNASSGLFLPPHQGQPSSTETKMATSRQPSLCSGMAREASASARISSTISHLRRKLQAKQAAPLLLQALQLPPEPDFDQPCSGGSPRGPAGKETVVSWEALHQGLCARPPLQNPAQESHPTEQAGDRWLCLPSAPQQSLSQQPKDSASSGGDFAPTKWGLLPSGVLLMSAMLSKDRRPHLVWPPNICILSLAMMIAGIPTIPVPGVREEDMIQAAQCFMAENLEPGEGLGEIAQRQRWAAIQRLRPSGKRDKQRKRTAHRSLLPLFQLEK
ncbi:spermatogenesis-associated protein 25 [Sceloporus undulatus]|uniref:spermatogenesis-associated protein 25 n=1 Tax=Sceloporus undulatus TaxID=8520 RepID=UPI001C4C0EEA|nr:spermatogenesis-associated protein 25 [Sceloporus undulatus]